MPSPCRIPSALALVATVAVALGCGSDRLTTVPVSGTVTLDGRPVPSGKVVFTPERGPAATGAIESDGSFTLGTYGETDGATLGPHRVAVIATESQGNTDDLDAPRRWLIPPRYGDPSTSGLTFTVESNGPNRFDLRLSEQP